MNGIVKKSGWALVKHDFSTAQLARSPSFIIYKHLKLKELEHNVQVLLTFEKRFAATPKFWLGAHSKGATTNGRYKKLINEQTSSSTYVYIYTCVCRYVIKWQNFL